LGRWIAGNIDQAVYRMQGNASVNCSSTPSAKGSSSTARGFSSAKSGSIVSLTQPYSSFAVAYSRGMLISIRSVDSDNSPPFYVVRILVIPNSEKHRLSQPIIPGAFGEFDLADHRRFCPTATLHFGGG
jgi:hypothetical protein